MRVFHCLSIVFCCSILSGCVADRLNFWSDDVIHKRYEVTGIEDDSAEKTYIDSIVENGFSDVSENPDDIDYAQGAVRLNILKAMRSKGYYDASVTYHDGDTMGVYNVAAGEVTRIKTLAITPKSYEGYLEELSISVNDPLSAAVVLQAQSALHKNLQAENCAFALKVGHKALLDPATRMAELHFYVEQGQDASFGGVSFSGQDSVKESYLRQIVSWKEGNCFRHDKIEAARNKIMATGLFSRVDIKLPEAAEDGGVIPVEFVLKEKLQRSVRAGVSYYTDEGPGMVLGWEHRNFLGSAEKFNANLTLSLREQSVKTTLSKSHFLRKDQSISFHTSLDREDTDAYEKMGIGAGLSIKRSLRKYLSGRVGGDIEFTRIKDEDAEEKDFALFSPFTSLSYDSRDNILDPHKGWVFHGSLYPFIDVFGEVSPFVKLKVGAQGYYSVHDKIVLAGRLNIGSIAGADTDDIPASKRFYAGGGGSVRGFGYQEIGPFEDNDPAGGRSLVEGAAEVRFKMSDTLGAVVFLDAGQVNDDVSPGVDDLSVGAGVGFRYYTDFGPIRLDVGVPLSGKDNTDQSFQLYISIGQAF
ncbi:MAG: hypothetical protein COA45_01190 [Zetaproteobacteria bacterium]|nr:MAG: hypothetical protein COA45_01190 [Zetaproteobacteria bacterium]